MRHIMMQEKRWTLEQIQNRTDMIGQIRQVMPHIKDSDMEELGEQVLGKLQNMTDEEFAEISLEAAEWMWVGTSKIRHHMI